jgi:anthranilate phosphoribosyltransferase
MFAPMHHSAMKYAVGPRQELAMRTIFNVLGPLTNPAGARRQVLGVFNADLCPFMAAALKDLGSEHVMVVHGNDGLDEISICQPTEVCELKGGELTTYQIDPREFGHYHASLDGLAVSTAGASAALIKAALGGDEAEAAGKARSIIALNAGAGLYVGGQAQSLSAGVQLADETIASGAALAVIDAFANKTTKAAESGA